MSDHTWLSIAIHTLVVKITCCARNDLPSTYNCSTHLIVGLSGCCSWSTRINPFVHMSKTYPLNIQSRAMTAILYWHYTTPPCYRPMQCTVAFLAIIFLRLCCSSFELLQFAYGNWRYELYLTWNLVNWNLFSRGGLCEYKFIVPFRHYRLKLTIMIGRELLGAKSAEDLQIRPVR